MKIILLILTLVGVTGCSGAQLKRCPSPVEDAAIMQCPEGIDEAGLYRKCEAPKALFRCEDPR